jgi:hypothetical protein
MLLHFVINGASVQIDADLAQPISVAAHAALTTSANTGRPLTDFELRAERGQLLDMKRNVEDFAGTDLLDAALFLTPSVGAGGSADRCDPTYLIERWTANTCSDADMELAMLAFHRPRVRASLVAVLGKAETAALLK